MNVGCIIVIFLMKWVVGYYFYQFGEDSGVYFFLWGLLGFNYQEVMVFLVWGIVCFFIFGFILIGFLIIGFSLSFGFIQGKLF